MAAESELPVDVSKVYSIPHLSGEIKTGTILDALSSCAVMGGLTLKQAQLAFDAAAGNLDTVTGEPENQDLSLNIEDSPVDITLEETPLPAERKPFWDPIEDTPKANEIIEEAITISAPRESAPSVISTELVSVAPITETVVDSVEPAEIAVLSWPENNIELATAATEPRQEPIINMEPVTLTEDEPVFELPAEATAPKTEIESPIEIAADESLTVESTLKTPEMKNVTIENWELPEPLADPGDITMPLPIELEAEFIEPPAMAAESNLIATPETTQTPESYDILEAVEEQELTTLLEHFETTIEELDTAEIVGAQTVLVELAKAVDQIAEITLDNAEQPEERAELEERVDELVNLWLEIAKIDLDEAAKARFITQIKQAARRKKTALLLEPHDIGTHEAKHVSTNFIHRLAALASQKLAALHSLLGKVALVYAT